jgi:Xaa-Pro aminopeptidase
MGIQSFGEKFNLDDLLSARKLAREICYELSSLIRPGMTEIEAHNLYKDLCKKHPVEKQWHPPKIRFGPNTLKNFREESAPYILKEEDIFFIDIGPTYLGHEADYGETFVIGNSHEQKYLANISKKVFEEVRDHWKKTQENGPKLYAFAEDRANHYDLILNPHMDGHRLGDFPHHIHFKGALLECEEAPIPNAWILEIHLQNKERTMGAFFEDLLTDIELDN